MFAVFLAKQGLKHQSIKGYLSALRHLQIAEGLGDPFLPGAFPRLEYVLKGVKHTPSAQARPPRLPITPPILRRLWGLWSKQAHNPGIVMLWAACCLGFFGFMHSGEFTTASIHEFDPQAMLTPADVSVDSHQSPPNLVRPAEAEQDRPFQGRGKHLHGSYQPAIVSSSSRARLLSHSPANSRSTIHLQGWVIPLQGPPGNTSPPGPAGSEY